jgi:hypothetical protein
MNRAFDAVPAEAQATEHYFRLGNFIPKNKPENLETVTLLHSIYREIGNSKERNLYRKH